VRARNRRRVGGTDVDYVEADVFAWRATRTCDVVFFSFWLSHVTRARFRSFWRLVRECLSPGGRAFFIDNRTDPTPGMAKDPYVVEYRPDLHVRRLEDGSEYRVVKVMYEPDELRSLLRAEGWDAETSGTRWFIFGFARPME